MNFRTVVDGMQSQLDCMLKDASMLYVTGVDPDAMWTKYLSSFPEGTNRVFRMRGEYDCSCCRHFVKRFGNVVSIKNGVVSSIWDFTLSQEPFKTVLPAMSEFVKSHEVTGVFHIANNEYGNKLTREMNKETGGVTNWEHFYVHVPARIVDRSSRSDGEYQGLYRSTYDVFRRSLEELTMDSIDTVLELIASNTLYRGAEWFNTLNLFKEYKQKYESLQSDEAKSLYVWERTPIVGNAVGHIRNHSIGTLLIDISAGTDLETALRKYEAVVAPSNYKRPKAVFTKKMLDAAKKELEELGYMQSLPRRFAKLDDISAKNILFLNRDSASRVSDADDVFASMSSETKRSAHKFDRVQEIAAEDFVKNVLPNAREVEAYVDSSLTGNLVSLIAPQNMDAPSMFKWNNPFSWAYNGNVADSMKQLVKERGGKVDGVLRFSIQWNDDPTRVDRTDLDAHCIEPSGGEIAYFCRLDNRTGGNLDVDITHPHEEQIAVENITWPSKARMPEGDYKFFVHVFADHNLFNPGMFGFKAEIEFDGQMYNFEFNQKLRVGQRIDVATVTKHADGSFTIKPKIPYASQASKQVWGINMNDFVPVSTVMYSPNYWDEQLGIGNRHYFFMLNGCVNDKEPNGFYNEFLRPELEKHKHVMEALGSKVHVVSADDQLSGVGFASTKRASLIVRVTGSTKRIMKVVF